MFPEDKIIEIFSICDDFSKVFDKGKIPSEAATVYLKNTDFYISPQVVPIRVKNLVPIRVAKTAASAE